MSAFFLAVALLPGTTGTAPPAEEGVLLDFTPTKTKEEVNDLTLRVEFGGGLKPWVYSGEAFTSDPVDLAFLIHDNLERGGVKAEIVDKTKVRVLGREKDGKLHPPVKGTAASKTLPAAKLPKITNPPQG
jgi:hypothetical protein